MTDVVVAGVGIHPFGRFGVGYRRLGAVAAAEALDDAGIALDDVDMVLVANVTADMAKGQNVIDQLGRPGMPVLNVEAACASSAGTLLLASQILAAGAAGTILCLGVEEAPRGFIANAGFEPWQIATGLGVNPVYFALAAQELLERTDATVDDLADVSVKNHAHAVHNPNAMYREACTRAAGARQPARVPAASPAHAVRAERGRRRRGADAAGRGDATPGSPTPCHLEAVSLVSRGPDDWFVPAVSFQTSNRTSLTARAAALAYERAGVGPEDVDVVECQDTDAASELLAYRDLGLCPPGDEAKLLRSGDTALGRRNACQPVGRPAVEGRAARRRPASASSTSSCSRFGAAAGRGRWRAPAAASGT